MIFGMYAQDFMAYLILGVLLNFALSIGFGLYLTKNIGVDEMIKSAGERKQSVFIALTLFIPFAKMAVTLYRIAVLQFNFLNQGKSHKDFWIYLTH